jgi:UDP-glucose 4-epimerase
MSVLVTGGTGCLGYHLLSMFTKTKGPLISYSLSPPKPYRFLKHVNYYEGDLLEEKKLSRVLKEHKPTEIYHAAAQTTFWGPISFSNASAKPCLKPELSSSAPVKYTGERKA